MILINPSLLKYLHSTLENTIVATVMKAFQWACICLLWVATRMEAPSELLAAPPPLASLSPHTVTTRTMLHVSTPQQLPYNLYNPSALHTVP